jgi:hypothetical protein
MPPRRQGDAESVPVSYSPGARLNLSHEEFLRLAGDVLRYAMTPDIAGRLLSAALTPDTIKQLADSLALHLPPHVCPFSTGEKEYIKTASRRWDRACSVTGAAVISSAVAAGLGLLALGVKLWTQSKGTPAP